MSVRPRSWSGGASSVTFCSACGSTRPRRGRQPSSRPSPTSGGLVLEDKGCADAGVQQVSESQDAVRLSDHVGGQEDQDVRSLLHAPRCRGFAIFAVLMKLGTRGTRVQAAKTLCLHNKMMSVKLDWVKCGGKQQQGIVCNM
eukprot:747595-Hanusia_phi.AAC.1